MVRRLSTCHSKSSRRSGKITGTSGLQASYMLLYLDFGVLNSNQVYLTLKCDAQDKCTNSDGYFNVTVTKSGGDRGIEVEDKFFTANSPGGTKTMMKAEGPGQASKSIEATMVSE